MFRKSLIYVATATLLIAGTSYAQTSPKDVDIETAYEDDQGNLIVRFDYKSEFTDGGKRNPDFFGTNLTFYGNMNDLSQQEQKGFGGTSERYVVSFADPRLKESGNFYAGVDPKNIFKENGKYELHCGDKRASYRPLSVEKKAKLLEMVRSGKNKLASLPKDDRKPEYLFKRKGTNQYIYVDAAKYNYSYESFRLFVGEPGKMNESKIENVERYRDGGTTYIKTKDGEELFSPTPFSQDKNPTWNKMYQLERLDPSKFDLKSLGIAGVPAGEAKLRTPCDRFFLVVPKTDGGGEAEKGAFSATPAK